MRSDFDAEKEPTVVLDDQNFFDLELFHQKETSYLIGTNLDSSIGHQSDEKLGLNAWEFQPEQLFSDEIFKDLAEAEKKFDDETLGFSNKV